ncbi:NAD(P)/FAD-dependent oxidoreductase [Thiohalorhabdus sp.]|uniref:NAD(P)/FAD-dependent oxidoreductase n=1 Tax=Thiohalorhabdus sp. TaxID=3094134 RepID=UPI002FC2D12B
MAGASSLEFDVVVVGAGFAGATLASQLERQLPSGTRIALVNHENYVTFTPLLPEVVGASILPGQVVAPIRQMVRRAHLYMVPVTGIDLEARRVAYAGDGPGAIAYRECILACGRAADSGLLPGMAEYATPLKTVGDALYLRNQVITRLEQAELEPDPERRQWLTTFWVLGGGFSGVEVAGEIHDFLRRARRYYPALQQQGFQVGLVHSRDRILPELPDGLADYAQRKMAARGIVFCLGQRGAYLDGSGVALQSGERLEGGTVVSTVGATPHPLVTDLGLPMSKGRLITDPDMAVPDAPGLWALGDCAAVPNGYDGQVSPPTAQFATRQARQLARNLAAAWRQQPTRAFAYRPLGQLSSIGHHKAVAELFGLRLSGLPAWLLWRGLYLLKLPTLARKIRVYFEWNWQMLFPPEIANLRFTPSSGRAPARVTGTVDGHAEKAGNPDQEGGAGS